MHPGYIGYAYGQHGFEPFKDWQERDSWWPTLNEGPKPDKDNPPTEDNPYRPFIKPLFQYKEVPEAEQNPTQSAFNAAGKVAPIALQAGVGAAGKSNPYLVPILAAAALAEFNKETQQTSEQQRQKKAYKQEMNLAAQKQHLREMEETLKELTPTEEEETPAERRAQEIHEMDMQIKREQLKFLQAKAMQENYVFEESDSDGEETHFGSSPEYKMHSSS